jgi:hypothetical protein
VRKFVLGKLQFFRPMHGLTSLNNFVIPTGAYPNFLLRDTRNDNVCGFFSRKPHEVYQRRQPRQEFWGSVVQGPAVLFGFSHTLSGHDIDQAGYLIL